MASAERRWLADARAFLRDIKLEHSIFALPFALLGMLLATSHDLTAGARPSVWPTLAELGWIVVAMVGTRTAAMGFNRVVDRRLDALNPRTATRPLAAGQAGLPVYLAFVAGGIALLLLAAWQLNPLALALTPLVLLVVLGYSFTKRLTMWCHFFVGLALAVAPLGAWVAVTGALPDGPAPYLLALAVLLWVGGFDIVYATMDVGFDRTAGIRSLPARLGVERALWLARASHLLMVAALLGVGVTSPDLRVGYYVGLASAAAVLLYEHWIVRPDDLRRVNLAFFTLNGVLGVLLLLSGALDLLWLAR